MMIEKILALTLTAAFVWLCAYSLGDLHKRQYDAHHHVINPLPSLAQIEARERNEAILFIFARK